MRFIFLCCLALLSVSVNAQQLKTHGPSDIYYGNDFIFGKDHRLLISTSGGAYFSDDLGGTWKKTSGSISNIYSEPRFTKNRRNDDLYAWDRNDGISSTSDNGATWFSKFVILPDGDNQTKAAGIDGDTLFIGTSKGLKYVLGSEIFSFASEIDFLKGKDITSIKVLDNKVFAGTASDGIYGSFDMGKTWQNITTDLPTDFDVTQIEIASGRLFVSSKWKGFYYSDDWGISWHEKNAGFSSDHIQDFYIDGDNIYVITDSYNNVYSSTLYDAVWTLIDTGIPNETFLNTIISENNTVMVSGWGDVLKSTNSGNSWKSSYNGITDALQFTSLNSASDGSIWAIASNTGVYVKANTDTLFKPFLRRGNFGASGMIGDVLPIVQPYSVKLYNVLTQAVIEELEYFNIIFPDKFIKHSDGVFLSSYQNGIYKYTGSPEWEPSNDGLSSLRINDFILLNNTYYAATDGGLFKRDAGASTWSKIPFSTGDVGVQKLLFQKSTMILMAKDYNTYISFNSGVQWEVIADLKNNTIQSVVLNDDHLYAAGFGKLFSSEDEGKTWSAHTIPNFFITEMLVADSRLYLATIENGILSTSVPLLKEQTISFEMIEAKTVGDELFTLHATASSGLPVTFTVVSGPVMIANNNEVTILNDGKAEINASQAGNDIYLPAKDVLLSFDIAASILSTENSIESGISVFPNPASGTACIHLRKTSEKCFLNLLNSQGQIVWEYSPYEENLVQLPIEKFPKGLYILKWSNKKSSQSQRLIIR